MEFARERARERNDSNKQFLYLTFAVLNCSFSTFHLPCPRFLSYFLSLLHLHNSSPHPCPPLLIGWINCIPCSNPFSPTWFAGNTPLLSISLPWSPRGLWPLLKRGKIVRWDACVFHSGRCCAPGYLTAPPSPHRFTFQEELIFKGYNWHQLST